MKKIAIARGPSPKNKGERGGQETYFGKTLK